MAKSVKLKDKNSNPLLPVTRSSLVEMNNGISLQTAYEGINSTHYTKDEINAMGYITTFNESDPTVPVFVKNITQDDISYWNNSTPIEIEIQYRDESFGRSEVPEDIYQIWWEYDVVTEDYTFSDLLTYITAGRNVIIHDITDSSIYDDIYNENEDFYTALEWNNLYICEGQIMGKHHQYNNIESPEITLYINDDGEDNLYIYADATKSISDVFCDKNTIYSLVGNSYLTLTNPETESLNDRNEYKITSGNYEYYNAEDISDVEYILYSGEAFLGNVGRTGLSKYDFSHTSSSTNSSGNLSTSTYYVFTHTTPGMISTLSYCVSTIIGSGGGLGGGLGGGGNIGLITIYSYNVYHKSTTIINQHQDLSSYVSKYELNEMGYLQNYTEYDPTVPSYVKSITQDDISYWNNKADNALLVTLTGLSSQNDEGDIDSNDGIYFTTNKTLSEINSASNVNVLVPAAIASQFGLGSSNIIVYPDSSNKYQFFGGNTLVDGAFWGSDGGYARFYVENFRRFIQTNVLNSTIDLYGGEVTDEEISNGDWDSQIPSIGVAYGGIQSLDYKIHRELNTASYVSSTALNTTLSSYVTSGYYDTTTHKIYLRHGTNVLSEIDANDFIKDGMVDTAYVQGSYLVISFNTDAGKQPVEVPIADIFNPTNYYTKTEINNAGYLTSHQDLSSYVSKTELNNAAYLQSETDPTVPSYVKGITETDISNWSSYANVQSDWNETDSTSNSYILNKPIIPNGLPAVTSDNNGYILQVVNGTWTLVSPMTLYSGTGTPNNTQGNNGDLYMQI